jgi:hypothetical protein
METREALESLAWLNIRSDDTIVEFLKLECLNISEADLVRALIRWGKYQLQVQDIGNLNAQLRSKILPGLHQIRFDSLTLKEFAQLCKEEFGTLLTGDEKSSIFVPIVTDDWKMMPTDVVSSKLTPRHGPYTFCPLLYDEIPPKIAKLRVPSLSLTFEINKDAAIVGVKLNLTACLCDTLSSITLQNEDDIVVGKGDPKLKIQHRGETFYKINADESLIACSEYKLTLNFAQSTDGILPGTSKAYRAYNLQKDKNPSLSDGLALEVFCESGNTYVDIQGILFEQVRSEVNASA